MGEVEQWRMSQPGEKRDGKFEPDEEVEKALLRGIETAWNNWLAYEAQCQEYEERG